MFEFLNPYYINAYRMDNFKFRPKPTVLHSSTCSDCGRRLVNIYYSGQLDRYICKKCLDKFLSTKSTERQ